MAGGHNTWHRFEQPGKERIEPPILVEPAHGVHEEKRDLRVGDEARDVYTRTTWKGLQRELSRTHFTQVG